jgi:predicted secreted protein
MAAFALTSTVLTVNSVNYADHVKSCTLVLDAAQLDTTDFASGGWTEAIGGLKSGTLSVTFNDDVADNDVDEELFDLLGTVVTFALKATSSAVSTSNPEYQGSVLVTGTAFGGDVGSLAAKTVSWPITGSITRDVTP